MNDDYLPLLAEVIKAMTNMTKALHSIDSKLDGIHAATVAGLDARQRDMLRRVLSDQMNEIQVERFLSELGKLPTTNQEDK